MAMKLRAPSGREIVVRPTLVDRVVNYFNPESGVKRLRARAHGALVGGYDGGRRDRRSLRKWRFQDVPADDAILPDLSDLRARSDELVRNTPLATGAVSTTVTHSVGTGLQLQATINPQALGITSEQADAMEREQEREWNLFCQSCDFTGVQSFQEMQPTAHRSVLQSGDLFFVRRYRKDPGDLYGTKLQAVVAARVSNPTHAADTDNIVAGVEVTKDGVPQAYHVSDKHPGALRAGTLNWERVPARDPKTGKPLVIHLFDRLLFDQTRGVPYLAPVIEDLAMITKYKKAELDATLVGALFAVFVTGGHDTAENPTIGEAEAGLGDDEVKLGSGSIHNLGEGEKIEVANPTRPNPQFEAFVLAVAREIGVALELPQELLVKNFTASYSASRAALELAWLFFKKQRTWLSRRLCQVVYEWMMEEAVASGRLNRPGFFEDPLLRMAYLGSNWIGPARIAIDPLKEAQADNIDINVNRIKTREQAVLARGEGRVEDNIRQLGKEQRLIEQERLPAAAGSPPNAGAAGDAAAAAAAPNASSDLETGDAETPPRKKGKAS